jgi:Lectin C-type domain
VETGTLYTPPQQSSNPLDAAANNGFPSAAAASGTPPVLTVGGTTSFTPGSGAKTVASGLTITGDNTTVIDEAKVIINGGFDANKDQLIVGTSTGTTGSLTGGINYTYDVNSGVLKFTGDSSAANYESALKSVKFDTTSTTTTARSIDFSLGTQFYLGSNGHFYGFVPVTIPNEPNKGISWTNAKAEAESTGSKFYNLTGYLATITSQEEQDFINNKIKANGWLGGNDTAVEGEWRWVTGPEGQLDGGKGLNFWNGKGANFGNPNGSPVSGVYSNWSPGTASGNDEPNDLNGEDYAHIIGNSGAGTVGKWNDLTNDLDYSGAKNFQVQGYIKEYGDKTTDANYPKIVGSVSVTIGATATGNSSITNPDFNKDGKPEIVWRDFGSPQKSPGSGKNAVWVVDYDKNATGSTNPFKLNAQTKLLKDTISDLNWKIEGTQDFNKDGITDLFWHNSDNGQNAVWIMKNDTSSGGTGIEIDKGYFVGSATPKGWEVKGVSDFDNDGSQNILWRNTITGANAIWSVAYDSANTTTPFSIDGTKTKFIQSADKDWTIEGWADFNKDNVLDILWNKQSTGENAVWKLKADASGSNPFFDSGYFITNSGKASGWRVEGAVDFNNDGVSDVLWHNQDGRNAVWLMKNGADIDQAYLIADTKPDLKWEIEGLADFTQDNTPDILWRNYATGENAIWRMKVDGTGKYVLDQGFFITPVKDDLGWQIEAPNPDNRDVVTTV